MSVQKPDIPADAVDWAFDSLDRPKMVTLFTVEQGASVGSQTEWISIGEAWSYDLEEVR